MRPRTRRVLETQQYKLLLSHRGLRKRRTGNHRQAREKSWPSSTTARSNSSTAWKSTDSCGVFATKRTAARSEFFSSPEEKKALAAVVKERISDCRASGARWQGPFKPCSNAIAFAREPQQGDHSFSDRSEKWIRRSIVRAPGNVLRPVSGKLSFAIAKSRFSSY